jgi:glycosidase
MQWDSTPHDGFSTADPWLPLADDFWSRTNRYADRNSTLTADQSRILNAPAFFQSDHPN